MRIRWLLTMKDHERKNNSQSISSFAKAIDQLRAREFKFDQDYFASSLVIASSSRLAVPRNSWTLLLDGFSFGVLLTRSRTIFEDLSFIKLSALNVLDSRCQVDIQT